MLVIETERLIVRHLNNGDAQFMFELLNDPGWIKFIGNRNIHTVNDAKNHIRDKYISSYKKHGYGLYLVEEKETLLPLGVCGLINRPEIEDIDKGFAFLPQYAGNGYAYEASRAVLNYGYQHLKLDRIVAITIPENTRSINLLKKLGMKIEGYVNFQGDKKCLLFVPSEDEKL